MAARKFTADELIIAVRDTGMVPDTGSTGTEDTDLLKVLDGAINTILVPRLIAIREDYFLKRQRVALGSVALYRIPHRAAYGKLRDLFYVDSNSDRFLLEKHALEDFVRTYDVDLGADPYGYFLEGDYVHLLPDSSPSFSGSLEFTYMMRAGDLTKVATAGVISSVLGKVITCTADVSSLFSIGDKLDVHSPYSGAEVKLFDLTVTNVATTDVTVSEDIDGTTYGSIAAAAGDYLVPAEMCVIPPLPRELHHIIGRAAAVYVAESIGDMQAMQFHGGLLEQNLKDALKAMESRIEGRPMRITGKGGMIGW